MSLSTIAMDMVSVHEREVKNNKAWIDSASDILFQTNTNKDPLGVAYYAKSIFYSVKKMREHRSALLFFKSMA